MSFTFGTFPSSTLQPSGLQLPSATTAIATPSSTTTGNTGFAATSAPLFGTPQVPSVGQPTGFSFGAPASSSTFSIPQAQTATGIPYPKETKFIDLPADVRTAIESLETTIRKYESDSCQLATRKLEDAGSFRNEIENLDKKMHEFDLGITQSRNKMLLAKRNLNQFWKYGESVARFLASSKQTSQLEPAVPAQNLLNLADIKFVDEIIFDLEKRLAESERLYENLRSTISGLQMDSSHFSMNMLKNIIKNNGESLLNLSSNLALLHVQVEALRDEYRRFCLIHRHDSRDPFSPKTSHDSIPGPTKPQVQNPTPIVAPSISSLMPSQQPQTAFSLPSATTLLKR